MRERKGEPLASEANALNLLQFEGWLYDDCSHIKLKKCGKIVLYSFVHLDAVELLKEIRKITESQQWD